MYVRFIVKVKNFYTYKEYNYGRNLKNSNNLMMKAGYNNYSK